jgi:phospholipid/cholesterol/gamma-HCH transport system substrate-binding protein
MNISNETKIGALAVVAITLLILGFNFLKGKSLTGKTTTYYAVFNDIQGLGNSNPVVINGKEVGTITSTDGGKNMRRIIVTISMKDDVNIPNDANAIISKSLLGSVQLDVQLGNSTTYLKDKDTIKTIMSANFLGDAMKKLDPVLYQVTNAVHSLDTLISTVNSIFDPASKNNIKAMLDNLNKTTASLAISSAALQNVLNAQTGSLAKTMDNVHSFTSNLKSNNDKLSATMGNVQVATEKFAQLDIATTLANVNATITSLKTSVEKATSDKGSLGLLMNDTKLYNNLNATSNKLNLLLDDVRLHPKRYINVSVFGKKDKTDPLMVPLPDTANAPYLNKLP